MEGSLVAYKVFTNGSVLNASEINDNLMNQSVMVFSNSTTRDAALTSPVEGMLTWLEDINKYENYDGTAWVGLGGGILQIVQGDTDVSVSSSTTTFADTGLSATITPSSTSSKILVLVNQAIQKSGANASNAVNIKIFRGATEILLRSRFLDMQTATAAYGGASLDFLDSPNTTSAVTYKTQFANNTASAAVQVQFGTQKSFITLMEVAG
jgi:hypothetical protein